MFNFERQNVEVPGLQGNGSISISIVEQIPQEQHKHLLIHPPIGSMIFFYTKKYFFFPNNIF